MEAMKKRSSLRRIVVAALLAVFLLAGLVTLPGMLRAKAVNSTTVYNFSSLKSALANSAYDEVVLGQDISLGRDEVTVSNCLTVPLGRTVTLNMNNHNITRDYGDTWFMNGDSGVAGSVAYIINNKGDLTISSPQDYATIGVNTLSLNIDRTDMKATDSAYESTHGIFAVIRNSGTVTVGKGVSLSSYLNQHYKKADGGKSGTVFVYSVDIWSDEGAKTILESGSLLNAQGSGRATCSLDESGWSCVFAYGVYGGDVEMRSSSITAHADSQVYDNSGWGTPKKRENIWAVAYGISTSGQITTTGGDITASTRLDRNWDNSHNETTVNGSLFCYAAGLHYTGAMPVVADLSVSTSNEITSKFSSDGAHASGEWTNVDSTMKWAVLSGGTSSYTAPMVYNREEFSTKQQQLKTYSAAPTAGSYKTEGGSMASQINTSNSISTMSRGATGSAKRIHTIYRFWSGTAANAALEYYTIDGNVVDGGSNYTAISTPLRFTGQTYSNFQTTSDSFTLNGSYTPAAVNSHYYTPWQVVSINSSNAYCDMIDDVGTRSQLFVLKNYLTGDGSASGAIGSYATKYVFVDFLRVSRQQISIEASDFTKSYDGTKVNFADITVSVKNPAGTIDFTSDYDLNKYEYWSWRTSSGTDWATGSTGWPVHAGSYVYKLVIPEDSSTPFAAESLNRYGAELEIPVNITPSNPLRGNIPDTVTLTYGQKLEDVFMIGTYSPEGPANTECVGTLGWGQTDRTLQPDAGSGSFTVTWVRADSGTSNTDYVNTTFTVNYTANKRPITVAPAESSVVYGENVSTGATVEANTYRLDLSGLIAKDSTDAYKAAVISSATYKINGADYAPGTAAGKYSLSVSGISYAPMINNYEISYNNAANELFTVNKRTVYAVGNAVNRPYDGTAAVTVNWSDYTNVYGSDDVSFLPTSGAAVSPNAGTQLVNVVPGNIVLAGADKDNYTPAVSGAISVVISKASPNVTLPTVESFVYSHSKVLTNDMLNTAGYVPEVAGAWSWDNSVLNKTPTVRQKYYAAVFTPADPDNYDVQNSSIYVDVLTSVVNISYETTVEFGAAVPNLLNVTYTPEDGSVFVIAYASLEGNLDANTAYTPSSPVGSYSVSYDTSNYKDRDGNYTFVFTPGNGVIHVVARPVTVIVGDSSVTYGDALPASFPVVVRDANNRVIDASTLLTSGAQPVWSFTTDYVQGATAANYYSVTAALAAGQTPSANYTIGYRSGRLTVNKAELTVTADDVTVTYGDEKPASFALSYSGFKGSDTAASVFGSNLPTADTVYMKMSPVIADGYPINVSFAGISSPDYYFTAVPGTLTVVKAAPTMTGTLSAAIVYTQTLAEGEIGGGVMTPGGGSFEFETPDVKPIPGSTSYTVIYTPAIADQQNYTTGSFSCVVTVSKKDIAGSIAVVGSAMEGQTLTADLSNLDPADLPAGDYTLTWYSTLSGVVGTGSSYNVTAADNGAQINVVLTCSDGSYYVGSVSSDYTDTVIITLSVPGLSQLVVNGGSGLYTGSVVYDGASHGITVTGVEDVILGDITVKYNNSVHRPVNAGTYAITVDISAPDDSYLSTSQYIHEDGSGQTWYGESDPKAIYGPVSGLRVGTLVVTPKAYTVVITIANKDYDGNIAATVSKVTQDGRIYGQTATDVNFDASRTVFTFSDANAGRGKTVTAKNLAACLVGEEKANYTIDGNVTIRTAAINKIPISFEAVAVTRAYDPSNAFSDLELTYVAGRAATDSASDVSVDTTRDRKGLLDSPDAGEGKPISAITAYLTGPKADNYYITYTNLETLTATVTKAVPVVGEVSLSSRSYSYTDTLASVELPSSNWSWVNPGAKMPVGTYTYSARFTPDDTDNYQTLTRDVSLTVTKGLITVTPVISGASGMELVYGSSKPNFKLSVSGTTGEPDMSQVYSGLERFSVDYDAGSPVGDYTVSALGSVLSSDNYEIAYSDNTMIVTPRIVTVTLTPVDRAYIPGNTDIEISVSDLENVYESDAGNSGKLALSETAITGTANSANAGTRTVSYTEPVLTGTQAGNYRLVVRGRNRVTINKADPVISAWPTSATVQYGQVLATAQFVGGDSSHGSFKMLNAESVAAEVGTFNGTTDLCIAVYTPEDPSNYNSLQKRITLVVGRAVISPVISITGVLEGGKQVYCSVSGIPDEALENLTYSWYYVSKSEDFEDELTSENLAYKGGATFKTGSDKVGSYVVCVVSIEDGESNYAIEGVYSVGSSSTPLVKTTETFWQRLVRLLRRLIESITRIFSAAR